jgi:hypothetical protein
MNSVFNFILCEFLSFQNIMLFNQAECACYSGLWLWHFHQDDTDIKLYCFLAYGKSILLHVVS